MLYLKEGGGRAGGGEVIEVVASKVGLVMLVLGGMHFFNLYIFNKFRKRALEAKTPVVPEIPVLPAARLAAAPGLPTA